MEACHLNNFSIYSNQSYPTIPSSQKKSIKVAKLRFHNKASGQEDKKPIKAVFINLSLNIIIAQAGNVIKRCEQIGFQRTMPHTYR